jgi:uncharacterized protein YjcR
MAKRKRETVVLLDYAAIAEMTGLEPAVLRLWKSRGKMPAADYEIAQSPGWLPATIAEWTATFVDGRPPSLRAKAPAA